MSLKIPRLVTFDWKCVLSSVFSDIQEFYEVTLLDSQRWVESPKAADPMAPVNLWDFSSLQSATVTSDTLPSLSTSIEVRTENFISNTAAGPRPGSEVIRPNGSGTNRTGSELL